MKLFIMMIWEVVFQKENTDYSNCKEKYNG